MIIIGIIIGGVIGGVEGAEGDVLVGVECGFWCKLNSELTRDFQLRTKNLG